MFKSIKVDKSVENNDIPAAAAPPSSNTGVGVVAPPPAAYTKWKSLDLNKGLPTHYGINAAHSAALYGDLLALHCFVNLDSNVVGSRDKIGATPLHFAAYGDQAECAIFLLNNGAKVAAKDRGGLTPLHCAAIRGKFKFMKLLLDRGAPVNDRDNCGATALMYASWGADCPSIQFLLDRGADLTLCTTSDQLCPVHAAALSGRVACVGALHTKGADLNARDSEGATPLHKAASRGDMNIVSFLVEVGASPDVADHAKCTPLHFTARSGSVACLDCLVDTHKDLDLNCATDEGIRPLHIAAYCGHTDMCSALIKLGADINASSKDGSTPLHVASECGHESIVDLLLQKKADVSAADSDGLTALHRAASMGRKGVVRSLLREGASIDAADHHQRTALHLAAIAGHSGTMGVMLFGSQAANCSLCDQDGGTSLHFAAYAHTAQCTKMLLAQNVDPLLADNEGNLPLHIAAAAGRTETVQLLVSSMESLMEQQQKKKAAQSNNSGGSSHSAERSDVSNIAEDSGDLSGNGGNLKKDAANATQSGNGNPGADEGSSSGEKKKSGDASDSEPREGGEAAGQRSSSSQDGGKNAKGEGENKEVVANIPDKQGHTALYFATRSHVRDALLYLLQKGGVYSAADREALKQSDREAVVSMLGERTVLEFFRESATELFGLEFSPEMLEDEVVDLESFEIGEEHKSAYQEALHLFNDRQRPKKAMAALFEAGVVRKRPRIVAHFLYARANDLDKAALGDYLGEEAEFESDVRSHYTSFLSLENLEFDMSLRRFLQKFRLPGEAQKIDRIMRSFATHFFMQCGNESVFRTADATYVTAFATIMLNTDAHSPNIKKEDKMTLDGFLKNVESVRDFNLGQDLPHAWLQDLYQRITSNPIKMQQDTMFGNSEKNGWVTLREKSKGRRTKKTAWKRRWLELCDGHLYWMKKPEEETPLGQILLGGSELLSMKGKSKKKHMFVLVSNPGVNSGGGNLGGMSSGGEADDDEEPNSSSGASSGANVTLYLMCEDEKECNAWMDALRLHTMENHSTLFANSKSLYDLPDIGESTSSDADLSGTILKSEASSAANAASPATPKSSISTGALPKVKQGGVGSNPVAANRGSSSSSNSKRKGGTGRLRFAGVSTNGESTDHHTSSGSSNTPTKKESSRKSSKKGHGERSASITSLGELERSSTKGNRDETMNSSTSEPAIASEIVKNAPH